MGRALDGSIIAYNWSSSIDGYLSDSAKFSTSNLSAGIHTIYFSVQNDEGVWSDEVSSNLIIDTPKPKVDLSLESHYGGLMNDVSISGNYAYISQGQSLVIVDISNRLAPSEVGRLTTPSLIQDIVIENDYAYIACGNAGIAIADISNPEEPVLTSIFDVEEFVYSVDVEGDYAYLAADGTFVVDVSDPATPKHVCGLYLSFPAQAIEVEGDYVYVSMKGDGLVVFNVSDPSSFSYPSSYLGTCSYDDWTWDIDIYGNYAYIAADNDGLRIINISVPSRPELMGSYDTLGSVMGVDVIGNYAYVAASEDGLLAIDVSDSIHPQLESTYLIDSASDVSISNNYAYLPTYDNGLCTINISDSTAPELTGNFITTDFVSHVSVNDNHAFYLSDSKDEIGIININNSKEPSFSGTFCANNSTKVSITSNNTYLDVLATNNYVYLTDYDDGLVIIDISEDGNPRIVGGYDPGYLLSAAVSGNYSYLVSENGLCIVDLSEPASPSLAGYYADVQASYVYVDGNYAYLNGSEGGLLIIDVSDPTSPLLAGSYDSGSILGITVSGNYAYLADRDDGLVIMDISDSAAPAYVYSFRTISAHDVITSEDYLYVVNDDGVVIFNISIPGLPSMVGSYNTAGSVSDVDVQANHVYIADSHNGLVVLNSFMSSESNSENTSESASDSSSTSSSGSSSGSGSGGGGGGGTTGELYENIAFKDVRSEFVTKDSVTSYDFEDENNEVEYIQFTASRNWGKISATIECLHDTSALVDREPEGTVYRNLNIWVGKSGFSDNIKDCVIGFKVSKEWLAENDVDEGTIRLLHYSDGEWEELDTELIEEDDGYLHFEARTPGFSPFAIVGDSKRKTLDPTDTKMPTGSVNDEAISDEDMAEPVSNSTPAFEGVVSMFALLLAGYCMVQRKKS